MELNAELELDKLRSVCRTLWPAVRFFGLTGAHPDYLIAAMDMGRLIGAIPSDDASSCDPGELFRRGYRAGLEKSLEHLKLSPSVTKRTGRSGHEALIGDLQQEFKALAES